MKVPKNTAKPEQVSNLPVLPFILVLSVLALLTYFDSHSRNYSILNRSWGFDHLFFYPIYVSLIIGLLMLFSVLPAGNVLLQKGIYQLLDRCSRLFRRRYLLFVLLAIFSGLIFYLLRVKYFLLGDLDLRMQQTMRREFVDTEYATMKLLYHFAKFGEKHGQSIENMFRLYSYVAGALYVFVSLCIANLAGKGAFQKLMIFCFHTFSGLLLVFCGYVEVYATPVLMLNIFILAGTDFVKNHRNPFPLLIAFAAAVLSHLISAAAFPALLVLFYFRYLKNIAIIERLKNRTIALLIAIIVVFTVVFALNSGHSFMLLWKAPETAPKNLTFFSLPHIWELLNGQMLVCGLNFVFIWIFFRKAILKKIRLEAFHYFLITLSGCFFLVVLVSDLQRGSGDWDLMAFPAVGINLLSAMLIFHLYADDVRIRNYLLVTLCVINSLHAFLWLQINHTDLSAKKVESMLTNDPANYYRARISGKIQLVLAFRSAGLLSQAEKIAKESCDDRINVDLRACVLYAEILKQQKRDKEVTVFYEDLLNNRSPYIYEAYIYLMEHYELQNEHDKVEHYLTQLYNAFREQPNLFIHNINFRPVVMIELMKILSMFENDKQHFAKVAEIKVTIDALTQLNSNSNGASR